MKTRTLTKTKTLTILAGGLLVSSLSSISSAYAADPYIGLNANLVFNDNADVNYNNSTLAHLNETVEFGSSWGTGLTAGLTFDQKYRLEGEVSYKKNNIDLSTSKAGSGSKQNDGSLDELAFMANGYYDFKNSSQFTPYIGAGIGLANVAYETKVAGSSYHVNDSDTVFAYQAMLGISYEITEKHTVYTGYKFFGAQDAEFKDSDGDALTLSNYDTHSVEVGYRYTF